MIMNGRANGSIAATRVMIDASAGNGQQKWGRHPIFLFISLFLSVLVEQNLF